MKTIIRIWIVVVTLAFVSCLKNDIVINTDDFEYRSMTIAAPLAKVHIPVYQSMEKWLDFDGSLGINSKGVICIGYTYSENIKWSDDIFIRSFSGNWTIPFGSANERTDFKVHLKPTDEDDSYVNVAFPATGEISITLPGASGLSGYIQVIIPELTRSGVAFTQFISLPSSATPHVFSLADYKIATDNDHKLEVQFLANISGSGNLNVAFDFSKTEVSYLSGYFGQLETKQDKSEIEFDFFDSLELNGTFGFEEGIEVETKVTNWTGIPCKIETKSIMFANEKLLYNQQLLKELFEIDIPAATEDANHNINPQTSSKTTTLSKIDFVKDSYPNKIVSDIVGKANYDSNVSEENFIVKNYGNEARIDMTFNVPLHLRIKEFSRNDTLEFDYKDLMDYNEEFSKSVRDFTLNLKVNNDTPFIIALSVSAIDDDGNIVEEIKKDLKINEYTDNQTYSVELSQSQLDNFWNKNVTQIVLYSCADTENFKYEYVYEKAALDVDVSVRFKSNLLHYFFE